MQLVKVGLVIAAGLGSTWVARQTTDAWLGPGGGQYLAQGAGEAASAPAPADQPSGKQPETQPAKPAVPEISREEMEAELRRAQAAAAGRGTDEELREFRPSRPLPADLPISLPSDI